MEEGEEDRKVGELACSWQERLVAWGCQVVAVTVIACGSAEEGEEDEKDKGDVQLVRAGETGESWRWAHLAVEAAGLEWQTV